MRSSLLLSAGLALATAARAQTDASLGVGAGTVRTASGASFSSLSLAPAFVVARPAVYLETGGLLSSLPGGRWVTQARATVWAPLVPETHVLRPALAATLAGSAWSDGGLAGAAHALAEILWQRPAEGGPWGLALGAGPSVGAIDSQLPVTALRLRARGWARRGPVQYTAIAEPTRLYGAWYTDLTAGVTFDRGRVSLEAWALARLSDVYPSTGTASAAVSLWVTPVLSLDAAAGGYLAEPFQGFPRARFVSVAIRLHTAPRAVAPAPLPPGPLVPQRRGDGIVVRFQMPGARSVAIAGDWTGWQPEALVAVAGAMDVWEAALTLRPGTYYFNLLVDGNDWVVPGGVATIGDGMGGLLAILVVP